MALIDRDRSLLLLIDYQSRLMPAIHESAVVVANARLLADAAALHGIPTLVTEQNPDGLGATVPDLAGVGTVIRKMHFGAGAEPGFLDRFGTDRHIVVAGCEAHVCVLQTLMGFLEAGRRAFLVRDGLGARTPESKETATRRLEKIGAEIVTAEMVVFEWLRTCEDKAFRKTVDLIKARDARIKPKGEP